MKTKIFVVAVIGLSFLMNGCVVRSIVTDLSPSVIKSDIKKEVSRNEAISEKLSADVRGQQFSKETATMWENVVKKDLEAKLNPETVKKEDKTTAKSYTVNSNGVVGGLPCQFTNDSQRNKTLTLTKEGGLLPGYQFKFDIVKQGGQRKYNLLPGIYSIAWTVEYDNNMYRPPLGEKLIVTLNPKVYDDRTGEQYHGGFRLFGY